MFARFAFAFGICASLCLAAQPPMLPGIEVTDNEAASTPAPFFAPPAPASPEPTVTDSSTWQAPSLSAQLSQDTVLIGIGMGAIFVPRFTDSRLEPTTTIQRKGSHSERSVPNGFRAVVEPGEYEVHVGTGLSSQQMVFPVTVTEGKTTVVRPDWSGLVVETMTSDGELMSSSYEVFSMADGVFIGRGSGQTAEREKEIRTWLLPPGLYRISKVGTDIGSPINYLTVQLNQGQLTHMEIVFDTVSGALISGGVGQSIRKLGGTSPWTFGFRLGGTVSFGTIIADGVEQSNFWNVISDFRTGVRYDFYPIQGFTEIRSRNNFQWLREKDRDTLLLVTSDLVQFQSSWIRRLTDWFGPYVRVSAKSHILPLDFANTEPDSAMQVLDRDSSVIRIVAPGKHFRIQESGYPLRLGEGIGVNLQPVSNPWIDISAQTGLAARQTWMKHVLVPLNTQETLFGPESNQYIWGSENGASVKLRYGSHLMVDLVAEIFLPKYQWHQFQVEELSADFRLLLIRNIELSYQQELFDRIASGLKDSGAGARFESRNSIQLRFFMNY